MKYLKLFEEQELSYFDNHSLEKLRLFINEEFINKPLIDKGEEGEVRDFGNFVVKRFYEIDERKKNDITKIIKSKSANFKKLFIHFYDVWEYDSKLFVSMEKVSSSDFAKADEFIHGFREKYCDILEKNKGKYKIVTIRFFFTENGGFENIGYLYAFINNYSHIYPNVPDISGYNLIKDNELIKLLFGIAKQTSKMIYSNGKKSFSWSTWFLGDIFSFYNSAIIDGSFKLVDW